MSRWFRWHEGTCEDGKFRVVARNAGITVATVMGVWAILLEDASHDDHRGIAVRGEDFYAAILDLGSELKPILEAMQNIGLIACCTNDTIEISNWSKRQYETDTVDATNAERQRRFREKRKGNADQTKRNGGVTAAKRPDTDTDTDTDTDKIAASPSSENFEEFKQNYPKRSGNYGWKAAERKYLALVKTGVSPQAINAAVRRHAEEMRKLKRVGTEFVPMPASWLNSEDFVFVAVSAFDDEPAPIDWENVVSFYKRTKVWTKGAGPDPDSPACRAPPEVLRKHGIQPTGAPHV